MKQCIINIGLFINKYRYYFFTGLFVFVAYLIGINLGVNTGTNLSDMSTDLDSSYQELIKQECAAGAEKGTMCGGGIYWKLPNGTGIVIPRASSEIIGSFFSVKATLSASNSTNDGSGNTVDLVRSYTANNPMAKNCADMVLYGKNDWYLPSIDELMVLVGDFGIQNLIFGDEQYGTREFAPGLATQEYGYISSTIYVSDSALSSYKVVYVNNGLAVPASQEDTSIPFRARCIRRP